MTDSMPALAATATTVSGSTEGQLRETDFLLQCQSFRPDLLRFACWLTRDPAVAEDVVQETLLRAWKARDSLLEPGALKQWLLTIIRNEFARTFQRKRVITVSVDELISMEAPLLALDDRSDVEDLHAAVQELPDSYRRPIEQVLMGYSTAEIAVELKLSVSAVLSRLFRARNVLRASCGGN